ncbi:MAG: hypothetical protein L3J14_07190, partial [Flavobacteriaceae bacterium]|nr:hypothetical protein [Flavobacteriaceae bacterium]
MELTKEQIQFIDDYLKEQKVKFWDVRIELIDHIASKLEENPEVKLTRTFLIREFGTSITLDKVVFEKQQLLMKKYSRLRFKTALTLLKSPIELIGFILCYYYIFSMYSSVFVRVSQFLFYTPILISFIFIAYHRIKKNKSLHLKTALYFIMLSVLFNSLVMNLSINMSHTKGFLLFILITFFSTYAYVSYKV